MSLEADTHSNALIVTDSLLKRAQLPVELPASRQVIEGHPEQVLIEAAVGADLLVVGSRGHGGFTGMLIDSVSAYVCAHAPCPRTPDDVAALLGDYLGTWWIAGGWAIEAFTGVTRQHDDIDPCVLRCDLPLLRRHLAGQLHLWTATNGALAPLLADDDPGEAAAQVMPNGCNQLWTDAVAYLQPEIQLLYKASGLRETDQADFTATLPYLSPGRRSWLRDSLQTTAGGHPWIDALND